MAVGPAELEMACGGSGRERVRRSRSSVDPPKPPARLHPLQVELLEAMALQVSASLAESSSSLDGVFCKIDPGTVELTGVVTGCPLDDAAAHDARTLLSTCRLLVRSSSFDPSSSALDASLEPTRDAPSSALSFTARICAQTLAGVLSALAPYAFPEPLIESLQREVKYITPAFITPDE